MEIFLCVSYTKFPQAPVMSRYNRKAVTWQNRDLKQRHLVQTTYMYGYTGRKRVFDYQFLLWQAEKS